VVLLAFHPAFVEAVAFVAFLFAGAACGAARCSVRRALPTCFFLPGPNEHVKDIHEVVKDLLLRGTASMIRERFEDLDVGGWRDPRGRTMLHIAAQRRTHECEDSVAVVCWLLERGCSVAALDRYRQTCLYYASRYGDDGILHELLGHRGEVSALDVNGQTALHYAVKYGQLASAVMLLKSSCPGATFEGSVAPVVDRMGYTAMFYATDVKMLDLLLAYRCSLNHQDRHGQTVLFSASRDGSLPLVDALLGMRVQVDLPDKHQQTALFYAAKSGHVEVVRSLVVSGGADPDFPDKELRTPRGIASMYRHNELQFMLLEEFPPAVGVVADSSALERVVVVGATLRPRRLKRISSASARRASKRRGMSFLPESSTLPEGSVRLESVAFPTPSILPACAEVECAALLGASAPCEVVAGEAVRLGQIMDLCCSRAFVFRCSLSGL
jgi:ankyrin repeat protein